MSKIDSRITDLDNKLVHVITLLRQGLFADQETDTSSAGTEMKITPQRIEYNCNPDCIARTILPADQLFQLPSANGATLRDVVQLHRRVFLLSTAGMGKTAEVENLSWYFSEIDHALFPIRVRLNTATDESIESIVDSAFKDWRHVSPSELLLVFDGLDEVHADYFERITSKIVNFTKGNPDISIVLTCREWSMDKWNELTARWKAYAHENEREIEFIYWGEHEIFERLSLERNRGRLTFWFNKDEFHLDWFNRKLDENIANLKERFRPDLNIETPIVSIFDGISNNQKFETTCREGARKVFETYNSALNRRVDGLKDEHFLKLRNTFENLLNKVKSLFDDIFVTSPDEIKWSSLRQTTLDLALAAGDCKKYFINLFGQDISELNAVFPDIRPEGSDQNREIVIREANYWSELRGNIVSFIDFMFSDTVTLSFNPVLVIVGEAGIGKSHLLGEIATQRKERDLPTILLLGQHFNESDPWRQILSQVDIDLKRDEFLAALDAVGEVTKSRVLIMIDAINEGAGRNIWRENLPGMVDAIKRFRHIGLVVTVRSSYADRLITPGFKEKLKPVVVTHTGFQDVEYRAAKKYFGSYGITQPRIPFLQQEFSNPLFLKLFCEGLAKNKLTEIPDGYEGITKVFDFFLDGINAVMSAKHDVPDSRKLVRKIVRKFAAEIAKSNNVVDFDKGYRFIIELPEIAEIPQKHIFFNDLVSEGVLTQNIVSTENGDEECLYIAYERLSDHLICEYHLDSSGPELGTEMIFANARHSYPEFKLSEILGYNQGLLEALAIQAPERFQREIFELIPDRDCEEEIFTAVVESIPWRQRKTFNPNLWSYIKNNIEKHTYRREHFIGRILVVAMSPDHFYNANFLHGYLKDRTMAERDSWWNAIISHKYHYQGAHEVKRIVEWVTEAGHDSSVSNECISLACRTLAWFLTSSDRGLRNASTKALVNILEFRIDALIALLKTFETIEEPYISQRLYAVACGCALRSECQDDIFSIAMYLERNFPDRDKAQPDILSRDYVRTIAEKAKIYGFKSSSIIIPPVDSRWNLDLTPIKKLEKQFNSEGFRHIVESATALGDFSRYTLKHGIGYWSGLQKGDTRKTRKVLWREFRDSLDEEQERLWDDAYPYNTEPLDGPHTTENIPFKIVITKGKKPKRKVKAAEDKFENALSVKQRELYLKELKPFLDHHRQINDEIGDFSHKVAENFILQRVIELTCNQKIMAFT